MRGQAAAASAHEPAEAARAGFATPLARFRPPPGRERGNPFGHAAQQGFGIRFSIKEDLTTTARYSVGLSGFIHALQISFACEGRRRRVRVALVHLLPNGMLMGSICCDYLPAW
jgi:hypothetical protein